MSVALCWFLSDDPRSTYVPIWTEKFTQLEHDAKDIDVLIVGTSRTYNGVNSTVVEKALANQGVEASVWNLSLHNLSASEQLRVLRDVLETTSSRPRMVVWEPALRLGMTLENATSARSIYFSDWNGFRLSKRYIQGASRGGLHKQYNLLCNDIYFFINRINYGRLTDLVYPDRYEYQKSLNPGMVAMLANKGYWTSELNVDGVSAKARTTSELEELLRTEEALEAPLLKANTRLPLEQEKLFDEIDQYIKAQGSLSLMVVMPKLYIPDPYYRDTEHAFLHTFELKNDIDMVQYLTHHDHRDLYRIDRWHDTNHLSNAGAEYLSELLAAEIAMRLQSVNPR